MLAKNADKFLFKSVIFLLTALLMTACLPPRPGVVFRVDVESDNGERTRGELISLFKQFDDELIFAPSLEYPKKLEEFQFDGVWSYFGSNHVLRATAVFKANPDIKMDIGYDTRDGEVTVLVVEGDDVTARNENFSEIGKEYAENVLLYLIKNYGEDKVSIVHKVGWE